jgi:hypothetical protein
MYTIKDFLCYVKPYEKTDPLFEKEVDIRQAVCLTRTGCLSIKKRTTGKVHNEPMAGK